MAKSLESEAFKIRISQSHHDDDRGTHNVGTPSGEL